MRKADEKIVWERGESCMKRFCGVESPIYIGAFVFVNCNDAIGHVEAL